MSASMPHRCQGASQQGQGHWARPTCAHLGPLVRPRLSRHNEQHRIVQVRAEQAQQGTGLSDPGPAPVPSDPLAQAARLAVAQAQADNVWDLDWFHYTPKWYKPHIVVIAGLSFIIGSNLATSPCLKTTLLAAAPVSVAWFIFLYMVPKQFKEFAQSYIASHPECADKARARALEGQASK